MSLKQGINPGVCCSQEILSKGLFFKAFGRLHFSPGELQLPGSCYCHLWWILVKSSIQVVLLESQKNGLPFAAGSCACGVVIFASLLK